MLNRVDDEDNLEWNELIELARRIGISIQEIREFLSSGQIQ